MKYLLNRLYSASFLFFILQIHYEVLSLFGLTDYVDSWRGSIGLSWVFIYIVAYGATVILWTIITYRHKDSPAAMWVISMGSRKGFGIKFEMMYFYLIFIGIMVITEVQSDLAIYTVYLLLPVLFATVLGMVLRRPHPLADTIDTDIVLAEYARQNHLDPALLAQLNHLDPADTLHFAQNVFWPET